MHVMALSKALNPYAESFLPQPRLIWPHYDPQLYFFYHQLVAPHSPDWPCYALHTDFVQVLQPGSSLKCEGARKTPRWVPKKRPSLRQTLLHYTCPLPADVIPRGTTTLMIKNVPNVFRRRDLLEILDSHCRKENEKLPMSFQLPGLRFYRSKYNFAYLPMDFCRKANLGYAFVNFTHEEAAKKFYSAFQHLEWEVPNNKKICEVTVARIQGFKALKSHFRDITYRYPSSSYLPVILSPPSDGAVSSKLITVGRIRL